MAENSINFEKLVDSMVEMAKATNENSSEKTFTRSDGWKIKITVTKSSQAEYRTVSTPPAKGNGDTDDYYDKWSKMHLSEFSFGQKCAALAAHIIISGISADKIGSCALELEMSKNNPDIMCDLDFENVSWALNYADHPIPLQNVAKAFKTEDERILAFAVCELFACTNDNIPEETISRLMDIAQIWGWNPADIDKKIRSVRMTHPAFFQHFLKKLFV